MVKISELIANDCLSFISSPSLAARNDEKFIMHVCDVRSYIFRPLPLDSMTLSTVVLQPYPLLYSNCLTLFSYLNSFFRTQGSPSRNMLCSEPYSWSQHAHFVFLPGKISDATFLSNSGQSASDYRSIFVACVCWCSGTAGTDGTDRLQGAVQHKMRSVIKANNPAAHVLIGIIPEILLLTCSL